MEKKLKTSDAGRRCKFPDCDRLLSIYNHQAYCRVHWDQIPNADIKRYKHFSK